jgi:hypothetical protein
MIKAKFGDELRSRTPTAQVSEAWVKVLFLDMAPADGAGDADAAVSG